MKTCDGLRTFEPVPSPKSQVQLVTAPVERSMNCTASGAPPSAVRLRYSIEMRGSTVFVRIASMMRPPDSALLQRFTTSLTASSLYSNGILWFSATRFLMRLSCSFTILPSISSDSG